MSMSPSTWRPPICFVSQPSTPRQSSFFRSFVRFGQRQRSRSFAARDRFFPYQPTLGFDLEFDLGFDHGFDLGFDLGFNLGFDLGFDLEFDLDKNLATVLPSLLN